MSLIGCCGSGKSSLLQRITHDQFSDAYISTIGVDFGIRHLPTDDYGVVKLVIWDTVGIERFQSVAKAYYKGCQGIIVVYSITDR